MYVKPSMEVNNNNMSRLILSVRPKLLYGFPDQHSNGCWELFRVFSLEFYLSALRILALSTSVKTCKLCLVITACDKQCHATLRATYVSKVGSQVCVITSLKLFCININFRSRYVSLKLFTTHNRYSDLLISRLFSWKCFPFVTTGHQRLLQLLSNINTVKFSSRTPAAVCRSVWRED